MAVLPGNFDASTLAVAVVAQQDIFKKTPNLYEPKSEVLQEVVKMQTADVTPVTGSPLNKIRVAWLNTQGVQAGDCVQACDITAAPLNTDGTQLSLTQCAEANFKLEVTIGNDPTSLYANGVISSAQALATGMLQGKKTIEEYISTKVLATIAAKPGVNVDASGQYGSTVTGTNTTVPAANWSANLFPYFQMEADVNRFVAPYLLDSTTSGLYMGYLNAIPNAQNDTNRDQAAKYKLIESAFDYFTFSRAGLSNTAFVVDGTATAFAARNQYANSTPVLLKADMYAFSTPSISKNPATGAPLFMIDVRVQRTCALDANGRTKYYDSYEMTVPFFDQLFDPYRLASATNTGTLKFSKV